MASLKLNLSLIGTLILSLSLLSCSTPEPDLVTHPIDARFALQGKALAGGFAACGFCHSLSTEPGAPLSGGLVWHDKYGEVIVPNITPAKSGVGTWTTNQLIRAVRASIGKNDESLSPEVHDGYEWMSDEDLFSVLAFVRSQEPVNNEVERRSISFVDRHTTGILDRNREVKGYVPTISKRFKVEYGRYVVDHVARCTSCHNSSATLMTDELYLAGGKLIKTSRGEKYAPGISGSETNGLGSWTEKDIVTYLSSGVTPEGRTSDEAFCPIGYYKYASQEDREAVAIYLKSVPPVE